MGEIEYIVHCASYAVGQGEGIWIRKWRKDTLTGQFLPWGGISLSLAEWQDVLNALADSVATTGAAMGG